MLAIIKNTKIKSKLIISFLLALFVSVLIGITGFIHIGKYNELIRHNESLVVEPMAYLSRIIFDFGQARTTLRDILIETNQNKYIEFFNTLEEYLTDLEEEILLYQNKLKGWHIVDQAEYRKVSNLMAYTKSWSGEVRKAAAMAGKYQYNDALDYLYEIILPQGIVINNILFELVMLNEQQAERSSDDAKKRFENAVITMFIIFATSIVIIIFFGYMITKSITKPVKELVNAAADLADGKTDIKISAESKDEIGLLGKAFVHVSKIISALLDDTSSILEAVKDGKLNERADVTGYNGNYQMLIKVVNSAFETMCFHFDAIPEGIAFFDLNRCFLYGNQSFQSFLNLHGFCKKDKELLSKIYTLGKDEKAEYDMHLLFEENDTHLFEKTVSINIAGKKDLKIYSLSLHRTGENKLSGKSTCAMLVVSDVTALMHAKTEAEKASRAKSDFLSHMSHEIRTPLNALIGMTQIARRSNNQEKIRNCIDKIESSSHHLLGIINDILDISKIEAGKLILNEEETSLNKNLLFIISMMESRAKEHGIKIELSADFTHDLIFIDSLRLNQVLMNLLSNAIKFSPDGGRILLKVEEIKQDNDIYTYRFSIKDQGIGMNEKEISKLFKSFEQADSSITRRFGGTGLGLAISKNLVEMMGGEINVASSPGKGSTFTFTIAARTLLQREQKKSDKRYMENKIEKTFDFSNLRALVVDDVEINRIIIKELLGETGMKIEEAEDGKEAVNMFLKSKPGYYDLVLMDMQMPVLDGCSATRLIRLSNHPDAHNIAIIAMTANVFHEDIEKVLKAGMDGHIGKPFETEAAISVIKHIISCKKENS